MTLDELRGKAERKLNEVMRACILNENIFPLPIRIAKPKTTASLSEWRETIQLIQSQSKENLGFGYTIEWESVNSKRHGRNDFPTKLSFLCLEDFLKYVGAVAEAKTIFSNAETLCGSFPGARTWCASHLVLLRKPSEVIGNAVRLVHYLKEHPNPGLYARQLPVQVPTKFFEEEGSLLEAMIKAFAPECIIEEEGTLEARLGLMTKESLIEFRSLDTRASSLPFRHAMATAKELAAKVTYFEAFDTVLVVENHITFLALPDLPRTLAIMGHGFAVHRLAAISWLKQKRLLYWGDIDLSGFSILSKFRESFPDVRSVMMDTVTFEQFEAYQRVHLAGQRVPDSQMEYLTLEEQAVVERLLSNGGMRLEQEHINSLYAQECLQSKISAASEFI